MQVVGFLMNILSRLFEFQAGELFEGLSLLVDVVDEHEIGHWKAWATVDLPASFTEFCVKLKQLLQDAGLLPMAT